MGDSVKYSCAIIAGDKKRQLKRDDHGYFEHTLGAFNVYNSAGKYYPLLDSVKKMFDVGGTLRRRLDNGQCRGEFEHPAPQPGQSLTDFIQRVVTIKADRVSHHIASVRLEESKDEQGRPVVLCIGRVKPSGPYGNVLNESLTNPEENVAFSIRSLTNERMGPGRRELHVTNIVTWDYVNEPGISLANKYQTPTLESIDTDILIPRTEMVKARDMAGVGMEDCREGISRVLTELGWETVQTVNADSSWFKW